MPGFLFITLYQYQTSRKFKHVGYIAISCVIASYIIKNILILSHQLILHSIVFEKYAKIIIECVFAFLLSSLCVAITESKPFNKVYSWLNHKSIHEDIWRDVIDYKLGTTLIIYCNNETVSYTGKLWTHEEKGLESWFVLKDYIINYINKDEKINSRDIPLKTTIAINLKNIDRIELYYNNNSKII